MYQFTVADSTEDATVTEWTVEARSMDDAVRDLEDEGYIIDATVGADRIEVHQ